MLVREDHDGGEGACSWEKIMLVGKNHVGGERSWWWERIMWLLQDGKLLQMYDLCIKALNFTERTYACPFAA